MNARLLVFFLCCAVQRANAFLVSERRPFGSLSASRIAKTTRQCDFVGSFRCRSVAARDRATRALLLATSENGGEDVPSPSIENPRPPNIIGVTLKIALDANGGVAELDTSDSERFTSPASLDMVHRLRRDSDAVLVGRGTVQADNPSLTVRRVEPRIDALDGMTPVQPLRVVLDPKFSLALEQFASQRIYQLFDDGYPTVVYHTIPDVDTESLSFLESVQFVRLPKVTREHNEKIATTSSSSSGAATTTSPSARAAYNSTASPRGEETFFSVTNIMSDLSQRYHVRHLMVEGGPTTVQGFLRAGLVDRAILVKAPICFREPLPSGITSTLLQEAGLELLGSYQSDADTIECWSRPHLDWPTRDIQQWP